MHLTFVSGRPPLHKKIKYSEYKEEKTDHANRIFNRTEFVFSIHAHAPFSKEHGSIVAKGGSNVNFRCGIL